MKRKMRLSFIFLAVFGILFSSCSWFNSGHDDDDDIVVPQDDPNEDVDTTDMGAVYKVSEAEYFKNGRKTSDWLIVDYCAADNSLDYAVNGYNCFTDLNEMEYGLFYIRNADASPRDGYSSVRTVVLWDGVKVSSDYTGNKDHGRSRILELGADTDTSALGKDTAEITGVGFIDSAGGEVDMTDYKTLKNFISWVNEHYSAEKVLLVVEGHGAGAGGVSSYLKKDGRSMLPDETSAVKSGVMSSREFATALSDCGYGSGKKFEMIFFDLCLGSCFEDAYEFRNFANYMVASPNSTPGAGMPYHLIIPAFTKNVSTVDLGKSFVSNFAKYYRGYEWSRVAIPMARYVVQFTPTEQAEYYNWYTGEVIPTLTFIDLSKVSACADAIDSLGNSLKDSKDDFMLSYLYAELASGKELDYYCPKNSRIFYYGTFGYLFDIGYFANRISQSPKATGEQKAKADAVMSSLSSMIVASWRDSLYYNGTVQPVSNVFDGTKVLIECQNFYDAIGLNYLGMTIYGGYKSRYMICAPGSDYYTELEFGKRPDGWAQMLKKWYGN
ncbi:MAG: clostripain-related cysteine peptidase [Treponema sp.]|nr:clostripain-related cysteine peptidase [Treponema sp.]